MPLPILTLLPLLLTLCQDPGAERPAPPNIVLILADDLGIGDPGCFNPRSRIPTPHLDRLAREGMRFTDAHSPSAVCSPTRYGLLTGRYAWRSRLKQGVLWGNDPMLIPDDQPTLASMLRDQGYATAVVGKWHLGLGRFDPERPGLQTDFSRPLASGPRSIGFEQVFVLPASLDIPPYLYVDGDRAREPADTLVRGSELRRMGGGGFWRSGPAEAGFQHDQSLPLFTERALSWIREHRARRPQQPFFLYFPLTAPHTPWVPTAEFQGRSRAGWYGDFVVQVDSVVGELMAALEQTGAVENTLVLFTSDNGSNWMIQDKLQYAHDANLGYRGQKADIHEGGHRVPMIARWPGRVAPGSVCDALIGLNDLYATLAELHGYALAAGEAPDSVSFLPALLSSGPGARGELVHHSFDGMFAIRDGGWKLIEGLGSGGFTGPTRVASVPGGPTGQLYDLDADPHERVNLWPDRPEVVERLTARLREIRGG
ncbi:MAG: arylsulfatase [Planctomycetes bacterium]|nr:arylsulfatase [Planctomycetota bacterium]